MSQNSKDESKIDTTPKRGRAYEQEQLQISKFASRPAKANHGRPIQVISNYHRIKINKGGKEDIHQYSVHITPEVAVTGKLTGQIIKACRE